MALMNWKQNIGVGALTPEKGKNLLKNFRYPTEIDKKGRLLIDVGTSKFVISFKDNGPDSTIIGVTSFKMKIWAFFLAIVLLCIFIIPGFIFIVLINKNRKKIFFEAVQVMNQNIDILDSSNNIEKRLKQLKKMKDDGIVSEEEFKQQKEKLLGSI